MGTGARHCVITRSRRWSSCLEVHATLRRAVTLLQLRGARSATQVSHMQVEMLNSFMHFRFSSRAAMLGKKTLKGQWQFAACSLVKTPLTTEALPKKSMAGKTMPRIKQENSDGASFAPYENHFKKNNPKNDSKLWIKCNRKSQKTNRFNKVTVELESHLILETFLQNNNDKTKCCNVVKMFTLHRQSANQPWDARAENQTGSAVIHSIKAEAVKRKTGASTMVPLVSGAVSATISYSITRNRKFQKYSRKKFTLLDLFLFKKKIQLLKKSYGIKNCYWRT